jgi:hypothetical protein
MSQFVPPNAIGFSAGTWALTAASNVWSMDRTAANATFSVYVPVPIISNSVAFKGAYLVSIELMWATSVEVLDTVPTVAIYKDTIQASAASGSGTLDTAAAVTTTEDAGHDTDAERLAIDEHRMVVTLSTPEWIDNDAAFHLEVAFDAGLNGVVKVFGAICNFTMRL